MMKNSLLAVCLTSLAALAALSSFSEPAVAAGSINFEKDILPALDASCGECHSARESFSNLRLDTAAGILKGGDLGEVLVPGKPDESSLYVRVSLPQDDLDFMPVEGDPLTEEQVEKLRQWIEEGADFGGWTGE